MKKVLLTNFNIINFTGSELDTITIAEYFLNNGYDVTIFTIQYGNPLYNTIDKRIKLIDYNNVDELESKYDIIWAHHYPLLDYLLFKKQIKADYIHYLSLSSFLGYEALPLYYKDLNMISTLSEDALNKLKDEKIDVKDIRVFPNYSFKEYFDKEIKDRKEPKKICIVSNHVVTELLDFKDIATENGIKVDIYGIGYKYTKITGDLLNKYDVVITIGKTINYALSLGIPCYCYDHFGGDGMITKDNILNSNKFTFSGKFSRTKRTGKQIYEDIIGNYSTVVAQAEELRAMAYKMFCLENLMENALKELKKTDKFDLEKVLEKYPNLKRTGPLFVEEQGHLSKINNKYYNYTEYCQVFLDKGKGFNENDSKIIYYYKDKKYSKFDITIDKNVKRLRLDFSDKEFVYLRRIKINGKIIDVSDKIINCIKYKEGYLSINNDPMIILEKSDIKANELNVSIELYREDQEKLIIDLFDTNKNLNEEVSYFRKYRIYRFFNKRRIKNKR